MHRGLAAGLVIIVLAALLATEPAVAAAPGPAASPRIGDPIPGRLLVRFRPATTDAQRTDAIGRSGGRLQRALRIVPGLTIVTAPDTAAAIERLRREPTVLDVGPDRVIGIAHTPDDPDYPAQWALDQPSDSDLDAPEAWDTTMGDPSIVIGVVDTGVDLGHADLAGNLWTNPGEVAGNGLDDDDNGYIDDIHGWDFLSGDADPSDAHGHGTHVAGIAAAVGDNALGTIGVAPDSRVMVLRVLGGSGFGAASAAAEAIDYAWRMGVRVLNLSWTWGPGIVLPIVDAIAAAGTHGVVTVAAAGNDGIDTDADPVYPAALDDPSVISVAATDQGDGLAAFSNHGAATIDVAAPGVGILSTADGGGTATMNGTSMAAPHVAGIAALVLAEHPAWSAAQVRDRIMATVRPVAGLGDQVGTGGVVNARAALDGPADAPPTVTVTSPRPGSAVLPRAKVTFAAVATDAEDGSVAASLAWRSSIDGDLGVGPSLATARLTVGEHLVAVTATDSAGHRTVRSFVLTVGPLDRVITGSPEQRAWAIAVGGDGRPRVAFARIGAGTYVTTLGSDGRWTERLVSRSENDRWVDIANAPGGETAIAIGRFWTAVDVYADPGIMIAAGQGSGWLVERATGSCEGDACGQDVQPSVAFDADGRERFVFVRQGLTFPNGPGPSPGVFAGRRTANGDLVAQLVRATEQAIRPTLAIGPDGAAHAAWTERAGSAPGVWYATDASGAWQATRLSTTGDAYSVAVTVAPDGRVDVLRATAAGVDRRSASAGLWGAWSSVAPIPAGHVRAAVDGDGGLHVVVGRVSANGTVDGVTYLTDASGTWVATDLAPGQAHEPDVALDGDGAAHVVYARPWPDPSLRHATNATGTWVDTPVVADIRYPAPGYAVDARGIAHVALFQDGGGGGIFVGEVVRGRWRLVRAVPGNGEWEPRPGLAVSPLGERHLVYGTGPEPDGSPLADRSVYYATDASGTWTSVRLGGNAPSTGRTRPIVIDRSGRIHVAFQGTDAQGIGLFYATDASGSWVTTKVRGGDWREVSMAVDRSGHVHLAAVANVGGNVLPTTYLTNESGSWTDVAVSPGPYDLNPSIALDAAGHPSIAYVRDGVGIRLVEWDSGVWTTRTVVDDAAPYSASLVIDDDGTRRILYDRTTLDYAACEVPMCPDYPGLVSATAGPTGPFTRSKVSYRGMDYVPQLVRGLDGSLSAAYLRGSHSVRQVVLAAAPRRAATRIVDGTSASVQHGATATLRARLTSAGGVPMGHRRLIFKVDGVAVGEATTDSAGEAVLAWTVTSAPGPHTLTIGYLGDRRTLAVRAGPRSLVVRP